MFVVESGEAESDGWGRGSPQHHSQDEGATELEDAIQILDGQEGERKSKSRPPQALSDLALYGLNDSMMQLALSQEVAGPRQQMEGAVTRHELRIARLLSMHETALFLAMLCCTLCVDARAGCAALRTFEFW